MTKTTDLHSYLTKISLPYQCRKSLLSYGIWNSTLNMIEIVHQHRSATKSLLSMGIIKNSKLYLYPEEGIFLMQCSLLHVLLNHSNEKPNIPISHNEAYSMWFNQSLLTLQHLHVYQYLTRVGFILIRHRTQVTTIENKEELPSIIATHTIKRKRDEYENEPIEIHEEEPTNENYICPVHLSTDCQRSWFPNYTADRSVDVKHHRRLIFPDKLLPVYIDWLPADYNSKVSNVELSIYENKILSPRPSYSLLRSIDLQSHTTIYQRLSSYSNQAMESTPTTTTPPAFFDMYTPRKHFRKTQPGLPDYYLEIKNGHEEFNFDKIYREQQRKSLTAIVHNGDIGFYTIKPFDPLERLQ